MIATSHRLAQLITLMILVSPCCLIAQSKGTSPSVIKRSKAEKEMGQRTEKSERLRQIGEFARLMALASGFQDVGLKIRAKVELADLAWDADTDYSTNNFVSLMETLRDMKASKASGKKESDSTLPAKDLIQLRQYLVYCAGKHSLSLAKRLLAGLGADDSKTDQLGSLSAALSAVDESPVDAGKTASASLRSGTLTTNSIAFLMPILDKLNTRDPEAAARLYADALTVMATSSDLTPTMVADLGTFVSTSPAVLAYQQAHPDSPISQFARTYIVLSKDTKLMDITVDKLNAPEGLIHLYLATATESFLRFLDDPRYAKESGLYLQSIFQRIQSHCPELVVEVTSALAKHNLGVSPQDREGTISTKSGNTPLEGKEFEQNLDDIERTSDKKLRDGKLLNLVVPAIKSKRFDIARKIADMVNDDDTRALLGRVIAFQEMSQSIKGWSGATLPVIDGVDPGEERCLLYLKFANRFVQLRSKQGAQEALLLAKAEIRDKATSNKQWLLLVIARLSTDLDPEAFLGDLGSAVSEFNSQGEIVKAKPQWEVTIGKSPYQRFMFLDTTDLEFDFRDAVRAFLVHDPPNAESILFGLTSERRKLDVIYCLGRLAVGHTSSEKTTEK